MIWFLLAGLLFANLSPLSYVDAVRAGRSFSFIGIQVARVIVGMLYGFFLSYVVLLDVSFSALYSAFAVFVGLFWIIDRTWLWDEKSPQRKRLAIISGVPAGLMMLSVPYLAMIYPLHNVQEFHDMVDVEVEESTAEELDLENIPVVTRETARYRGENAMSTVENPAYYDIGDYSIINHQEELVWVAPIEFDNFFSARRAESSPGYVVVSATEPNAQVELVQDAEIIYSPSNYFSKNAHRLVRNEVPDAVMLGTSFEPDEEGHPYYVVSLGSYERYRTGQHVEGVALVDAQSGEVHVYGMDEVPDFVNQVVPEDLAATYNEYYGEYKDGFWNSKLRKEGVHTPTVYHSASVTPGFDADNRLVWKTDHRNPNASSRSMVGYSVMDAKTGEMTYYTDNNGINTGYRAIEAVERHFHEREFLGLTPVYMEAYGEATFVVPTIDKSSLFRGVSIVHARTAEMVHAQSIEEAFRDYESMLASQLGEENFSPSDGVELDEVTGVIDRMHNVMQGDREMFYLMLEDDSSLFTVGAANFPTVIVSQEGDEVELSIVESDEVVIPVDDFFNQNIGIDEEEVEIEIEEDVEEPVEEEIIE